MDEQRPLNDDPAIVTDEAVADGWESDGDG